MSYSVGTYIPSRRVKRMHQRQVNGKARMSFAPLQEQPMRVVIRLQPGADTGEELLLLGALEQLKLLHDRINIVYTTSNGDVFNILKGNCFLKDVFNIIGNDAFQDIVGESFSLTVFEPDPETAVIAEEDQYRGLFDAEFQAKTEIQKYYQDKGMKDLVVDMPVYRFVPMWNKSNGYLWSIIDRLGIQLRVPSAPIPPFGNVPQGIRRKAIAAAAKEKIISQPFGVYDLRSEQQDTVLAAVIGKSLYPVRAFSIQELENAVGHDIGMLMGILQSNMCEWVIAPVGNLLYAAWAVGVPNVLTLYQGANPHWDGILPVNGLPLQRDYYNEEQLPGAIYQAITFIKGRANDFQTV